MRGLATARDIWNVRSTGHRTSKEMECEINKLERSWKKLEKYDEKMKGRKDRNCKRIPRYSRYSFSIVLEADFKN